MSTRSSFREQIAQRVADKGKSRAALNSPKIRFVLRSGPIDRPVDVVRALLGFGLTAKKANDVINRLVSGDVVPVELRSSNVKAVQTALKELGVSAWQIKAPEVEPKQVRARLELSQPEFATLCGLELDTLQNWEQGRHAIDQPARLLMKVIERDPSLVLQILTESDDVHWHRREGRGISRTVQVSRRKSDFQN